MASMYHLCRNIVSDRTQGEFNEALSYREALLTDYLFATVLPALHEGGELEGIVSVLELDRTFAAFVALPQELRKKPAPKFSRKNEAMFYYYFPELNVNYAWENEHGIFRAKVVMHCRRHGDVTKALSIFDSLAYIIGGYR
ncbi:hypothetical protein JW707_01790 [Candidatus Woesearchaeota archaeon]|nr:hypothetical protein [Candidatus Woesearchaeota archaeon]